MGDLVFDKFPAQACPRWPYLIDINYVMIMVPSAPLVNGKQYEQLDFTTESKYSINLPG